MDTGAMTTTMEPDDWLHFYDAGATLEDVADRLGVSKQHVPNLLRNRGRTPRSAAETRALQDDRYLAERGDTLRDRFLASRSIAQTASQLGLQEARARRLLEQLIPDLAVLLRVPRQASKRYSRQELIDSLLAAAANLPGVDNLTADGYARYAGGQPALPDGRAVPGPQVMALRFGSWGAAVQAAGLTANVPAGPPRRFDDPDAVLAAVVACWREGDAAPTVQRYEQWQRDRDGAPSGATVRKRLGSWNSTLVRAWQVVHELRLDQDDPDVAVPETTSGHLSGSSVLAPGFAGESNGTALGGGAESGGETGAYRPADENAAVTQPLIASTDAYLAQERAVRAHARLQNGIAAALVAAGLRPRSPAPDEPQYDLAFTGPDGVFTVVEVKSCTAENQEIQLRLGLGQVLRYAHQLRRRHPSVRAVLATELALAPEWLDLLGKHAVATLAEPSLEGDLVRLLSPVP